MDDQAVKAAIRSVKAVYPNAFAERCANGGCVIRQSLQRGIVIGYVSPGDHIAAWLDADRRISEGHNAKAQAGSVAENRYQPKGQSISPDGTGGFMTEQEKAFEEAFIARQQLSRHTVDRETAKAWFLSGYAAGECAARQEWRPIETAPKDCLLIVSDCRSIALAHIVAGDVWTQYVHGTPMLFQPDLKFKPSHWMPLPEATIREEIHRRKAMERKNGVAIRHQPECLLAGEINDGSVVCGCKSKQGFG
jgi:hypothetical protein